MTLPALFGIVSAVLSIALVIPYARDVVWGTTRPHRATWFVWAVLGTIAFFTQYAAGATDSLWMTFGQTASVILIFALSLWRGVGGLENRDVISLVAAGGILVLWYFTESELLALLLLVTTDLAGGWLTIRKAYIDPLSETFSTYALALVAGVLGALSVGSLDVTLLLYPMYIAFFNICMVVALMLGYRAHRSSQ